MRTQFQILWLRHDMTLHTHNSSVMGPMTRCRSPGEVSNEMNVKYYSQRATEGGLLITEGNSKKLNAEWILCVVLTYFMS